MRDKMTLRDIIELFSLIGLFVSLLIILGICGGLEQDQITISETLRDCIPWAVIFTVSAIGLIKTGGDED